MNQLEVTSRIQLKGIWGGEELPRAQDYSSTGDPLSCWVSPFPPAYEADEIAWEGREKKKKNFL